MVRRFLLVGTHNARQILYTLKYSIAVLLLFFIRFSFGQQSADSLKKYSYLLTADTILPLGLKGHAQGTAFFIENNKRMFLICAKHTLSGCDNKNFKDERYPETIKLWTSKKAKNFSLNTKIIKDTAKCEPFVKDPDIIHYPISDKLYKNHYFSTINDYISDIPTESTELVLWGFSKNGSDTSSTLFLSYRYNVDSTKLTSINDKLIIDNINYYITIQDKKVNDDFFIGFSGCPVFLKDTNNKYAFIGLLCAVNNRENALYVVRPKYLF